MAITVTCSNGHLLRIKDKYAGKSGLCSYCHVRIEVPANERAFEDEVLTIVGPPRKAPPPDIPEDSIHDGASVLAGDEAKEESGVSLVGSSLLHRRKVCPQCRHIASFAFTVCPRCGTPLAACLAK